MAKKPKPTQARRTPTQARPTYSFDTSAFVQPFRRYYPMDIAPTFWRAIEDKIACGEIISIQNVRIELEEKDDALTAWAKAQRNLFCKVDMATQARTTDILSTYPHWVDPASGKNDADPWVVALAQVQNLIVVSDEHNGGPTNLKIPYVCQQLQVSHLSLIDFIRRIGLRW